MNDLLTDDELIEVTGAERPTKQAEVLAKAGIYYWTRLDGRIRTTWFHVNHPYSREQEAAGPKFDLIHGQKAQSR